MSRNHHSLLAVAILFQLCWACQTIADDADWVRVVPEETDEILANPGMGWETFHKSAKQDRNLPAWIPSTIHYARWGWNVLEPVQGKIDYDFLDGILKDTRESGQQLAFRVMCCSPYPRRPYAVSNGTGWRADSLGDLGSFSPTWNHMFNSYPKRIQAIQDLNAWKNGPIAFEPPAAVAEFVEKGWPLRWIFNYGLAVHGSSFSGKSGRLPDDEQFRQELERFLRRLGYRLVLKELSHPSNAQPGTDIRLAMKWQNVGSAPCYKPYRVAYRLSSDQGHAKVFVGKLTVDQWLPGSIELFTEEFFKEPADLPPGKIVEVADTINLPGDLSPGTYTLSLAVVGQEDTKPMVQLAIKGRADDGWYPLSKMRIVR